MARTFHDRFDDLDRPALSRRRRERTEWTRRRLADPLPSTPEAPPAGGEERA